MSTDLPSSSDDSDWRSYDWVDRDTFAATPFYRRAWQLLKRDWLVFLWKLAADFVTRVSTLLFGFFVLTLFLIDFQSFVAAGFFPLHWFEHALHTVRSQGFIVGFTGSLLMVGLATTALQALVVGGIWGLLDDALRDRPVQMGLTFVRRAVDWFPEVLGLFLLRFALRIVTTLVGAALVAAVVYAGATGGLARFANWQLTILLAGGIAFFVAWAGLTRLAVEVVAAPLILDDVDLGEALLRGAHFTLDNFWSLYRLLIFAVGVLLIPLGLYWLAIMFGNLALVWPALETVGSIVQFVTEVLLFVSVTVVGVFFYGALFAFYDHDDERFDADGPLPGSPDEPDAPADDTPAEDTPETGDADNPLDEQPSLRELTPDQQPHRQSFDDVLPSASADTSSPGPDPGAGPAATNGDEKNPIRDDGAESGGRHRRSSDAVDPGEDSPEADDGKSDRPAGSGQNSGSSGDDADGDTT